MEPATEVPVDTPTRGPHPRVRLLPTIAVAAALAVVVFGGYVTEVALAQPAGPVVSVAGAVRVRPLSGWELAKRFQDPTGARLTRGVGNLDVVAIAFERSPLDLARAYVDQILDPQARQLSVSRTVERVRLRSGLTGVRVAYVGVFGRSQAAIEGEVTAVVSPSGVGAAFDAWAPEGLLQYVLDDTRTMIDAAEIA